MTPIRETISKNYPSNHWSHVLLFALIAFLAGCAGEKQNLVYDTFKLGITSQNTIIDETPLNPNLRYLKVDANGQPALLVLGYQDVKKVDTQDVWYSAFKEVFEIRGGRLANTEGLETNWTEVQLLNAPVLTEGLLDSTDNEKRRNPKFRFSRVRSVMPGYHMNIRETVVMEALNEAPNDIPKALKDPENNLNIRWIQETVLVPPNNQNPSIKPLRAIYAIDISTKEVIFGKQYLTPEYYVSWLNWPFPKKRESNYSAAK